MKFLEDASVAHLIIDSQSNIRFLGFLFPLPSFTWENCLEQTVLQFPYCYSPRPFNGIIKIGLDKGLMAIYAEQVLTCEEW